jgi:molybdenum cofactor biosynthesis protein MoaC
MPHVASVRAYHTKSSMSHKPLQQRTQPLADTSPFPRVFTDSRYLEEHHRRAFQLVWDYGLSNAALPEELEKVREEYDMLGPEYNDYWKFTAGSQLLIPGSKKSAIDELVAFEQSKLTEGSKNERRELRKKHKRFKEALGVVFEEMWKSRPENEGQPSEAVAEQAKKKGSKMKARSDGGSDVKKSGGIDPPKGRSGSVDDVKQDVEELLYDVDRYTAQKKTALEREHEKSLKEYRKTYRDLTDLRRLEKKKLTVHREERTKKLRLLEQHRLDIAAQKRDLLLRLKDLNMAEREAKKRKKQEELLARREALDPVQLSNILDKATERAERARKPLVEDGLENMMYAAGGTLSTSRPATEAIPSMANSPTLKPAGTSVPKVPEQLPPSTSGQSRLQTQDTDVQPRLKQPILPSKSDDLHMNVPASGEIRIDDNLTITLNADISVLQSQVTHLELLLRSSYPRIDAAPFSIEESTNRQTLQTWLKILASRYRSRFDVSRNEGETDHQVKSIMDHMVRDQDLSNAAAERMAEKWKEILEHRKGREGKESDSKAGKKPQVDLNESSEQDAVDEQPEAALDLDEWNVGGMGFLNNDETVAHDQMPKTESPRKTIKWSTGNRRTYSTSSRPPLDPSHAPKSEPTPTSDYPTSAKTPSLPHLTPTGSAHMVSVSSKAHTTRTAIAIGTVYFSNPVPLGLIKSNSLKKGDVLSVSRIAGIMAAKKCPDLIPLCHPIALTHVGVELKVIDPPSQPPSTEHDGDDMGYGHIMIESKVQCTGPTGVEMEALTSVMGSALSVVDMCKAVDKFQRIGDVRVVLKEGGKSGVWREEGWRSFRDDGVE